MYNDTYIAINKLKVNGSYVYQGTVINYNGASIIETNWREGNLYT